MILLFFAIQLPQSILSYNLDTVDPLIFTNPLLNTTSNRAQSQVSFFGYSVLLIPKFDEFEAQLIIGAPRGNYSHSGKVVKEPGIIYQCALSRKCHPISPTSDSSPDIAIQQIGMYAKVIQDNGWFGMSIVAIHPTLLKICAPHTTIYLFKPFTHEYSESMQGMCYFYFKSTDGSFLQIETESLATYNFSSFFWYNPEHGFSQNVAIGIPLSTKLNIQEKSESIVKNLLKNTSLITGSPTYHHHGSINIVQSNIRKTLDISNDGHEVAEFGYSVTSGCYFKKNEILFASGAPAWKFTGKVAIVNSNVSDPAIVQFLHGHELGEFFGASLASGDLNNDGFDDLVVGAPHYGNDNGKVYIYPGSQDGFTENNPITIGNSIKGAQFGYSLSCDDLDKDGLIDLVVGAPWEKSGTIYIYNGNSVLDEEKTLQASQIISAIEISSQLQGFGFSLSNLADVDSNGFLDIAVGAYKSEHVVILRSKPVEMTQIDFKVQPTVMKKTTLRISPEFCLRNYKNLNPQIVKNYTITIVIDSKYKRFNYDTIIWDFPITEKTYQVFQYRYSSQQKASRLTNPRWNGCITSHFNTKTEIRNLFDPVEITLTYELNSYLIESSKNSSDSNNFCNLCPIKYIGKELKPTKLSVPFEIDCGKDKICNSDISVTTSVIGVTENNTWEIGSGDISIEVKFQNHGEPAFFVIADFSVPRGIHLRSILSFCQEELSENLLHVSCNVGNSFDNEAQKTIKLDLDMHHFETHNLTRSVEDRIFVNLTIKSQTNNLGVKQISIPITLRNNIATSITGETDQTKYYLTDHDQRKYTNITFHHVYNVLKHGASPISEGKIIISVPTRIGDTDSFVTLKKSKFQVHGSVFDCISDDIPLKLSSKDLSVETLKALNQESLEYRDENMMTKFVVEGNRSNFEGAINSFTTTNFKTEQIKEIIFLNCSNNKVLCGNITCSLTPVKSAQDIGTIVLSFTVNLALLKEVYDIGTIISFSTEAKVIISKPYRHTSEAQVSTIFYNVEELNKIKGFNIWMILLSMTIGLLILFILTSILYYIGFFQKKQKLKFVKFDENEEPNISARKSTTQENLANSITDSDINVSSS